LRLPIRIYGAESNVQVSPDTGAEVGSEEEMMLQAVGTLIDREQIARQWLTDFSTAVQQRDFQVGRALFAGHVAAFGTVARIVCGLDGLEKQQWQKVWGNTRAYRFDLGELVVDGTGEIIWIAVPWRSEGIHADGSTFPRTGRVTFVLQQIEDQWLAVHSHHSRDPDGKL
jgi:ketosteroid isomerase-like protein